MSPSLPGSLLLVIFCGFCLARWDLLSALCYSIAGLIPTQALLGGYDIGSCLSPFSTAIAEKNE